VDQSGTVTPVDGADWIREALLKAPYKAEKTAEITAVTADGKKIASCSITLTFQAECIEADRETEQFDLVLTKSGRRSNPTIAWSGGESKKFSAAIYSQNKKSVLWKSSDNGILTVDKNGTVTPVVLNGNQEVTAGWIKEVINKQSNNGTAAADIYALTSDGKLSDPVHVILTFKVVEQTYSSGGSSGGGGGGGARSVGVTTAGNTKGPAAPAGAVTGTWTQMASGKWIFATDRTYSDEWAYISNPYAGNGQEPASWFRFDKEGFMVTGWQTDADGNTYYLKSASDGTQGQMLTGWQYIDGYWYYLNPVSDGTRGKVMTGVVIDGQYELNEKGQWVQGGSAVAA
jgi:hypothetical protein